MKTPHNYLSTLPEKLKTNKMHGERENDTLPTGENNLNDSKLCGRKQAIANIF